MKTCLSEMKTCSRCEETKPFWEFNKSRRSDDGLQSRCRHCEKAHYQSEKGQKTQYRYRLSEKCKATRKRYYQSNEGKASRERTLKRYPGRNKARSVVNVAILTGKIPRPDTLPCHYCSNPAQEYHHWHGYEKEHWLDVVPACRECHWKIHKKTA